jgi:elongation factor G
MRIAPGARDSGLVFTESLVGNDVDRVFVPSVEKGVRTVALEGVLAGFRIVDVHVDFYGGKMHPVDSKDIAFQVAGYHAFKESVANASPCLLEPVDTLTITTPEEYVGAVLGDLSARRGHILGIDTDGHFQVIRASVPYRQLSHYSTTLRSLTSGRGRHAENFSHYQEVPADQVPAILEEAKARRSGQAEK